MLLLDLLLQDRGVLHFTDKEKSMKSQAASEVSNFSRRKTPAKRLGGPQVRFPPVFFGIEETKGLKFHASRCFDSRESGK